MKYGLEKRKVEILTRKVEILMQKSEILMRKSESGNDHTKKRNINGNRRNKKKSTFRVFFFLSVFFLFSFLVFVSIFQSLFLFLPNYYATWKVGNIKILNVRKNIRHYFNCTSIGCVNEIKKSNAKHINIYVQPLKSWFVQNIHVSLHPYIFLREKKKWNSWLCNCCL